MKRALCALLLTLVCASAMCGEALSLRGWDQKEGYVYVALGRWPQTAEGDKEPIVWRVLTVEDGAAYLLSEYVLLAYTMEKWPANLLDILEPGHANVEGMPFIANARFPEDWFEHTTHCGHHCDTCGYCKTVFEKVARTQQGFSMLS